MPAAARLSDHAAHMSAPMAPGAASADVEIGFLPAWRALPTGMGAGVESALNTMKELVDAPALDPMTTPLKLAKVNAGLSQDAANAASNGMPGAPGTVASGFTSLVATNTTLTATYVAAAAVPGGEPAARTAYTKAIQAAAAAFASAAVNAIAGMTDIHACAQPSGPIPHGPGVVTRGSQSVWINNLPACRVGDQLFEAAGGPDEIKIGCDSVEIGDDLGSPGAGSPVDEKALEQQAQAQSITAALVQAAAAGMPLVEVCPQCAKLRNAAQSRRHYVAFQVVIEPTNEPVPGVAIDVALPDASKQTRTTDADGRIEFDDLDRAGVCSLTCNLQSARAQETLSFSPATESRSTATASTAPPRHPATGGLIAVVEEHKVQTGETLASLAGQCGMTWQQLARFNWNTDVPQEINARLRDSVGCTHKTADGSNYVFDSSDDPGIVLLPRRWAMSGLATDAEHVIRVRPPRTLTRRLIITLRDAQDQPRPGVPYSLVVGDATFDAQTNESGQIDQSIPADVDNGTLLADGQQVTLLFNQLESIDTVAGVQKRLTNLGYECGAATGEMNPPTAAALRDFQQRHQLDATGEITSTTRTKLKDVYGH